MKKAKVTRLEDLTEDERDSHEYEHHAYRSAVFALKQIEDIDCGCQEEAVDWLVGERELHRDFALGWKSEAQPGTGYVDCEECQELLKLVERTQPSPEPASLRLVNPTQPPADLRN